MQDRDAKNIADNSPLARTDAAPAMPAGEGYGGPDYGSPESGSGVQERAREFAGTAQEKVNEYGSKVQERADVGMDKAADSMGRAAEQIREKAQTSGGIQAEAGVKLADGMEKTATYLREHDTTQVLDDLETYVREHPMQAVAGAVIGGFVIGRMLR